MRCTIRLGLTLGAVGLLAACRTPPPPASGAQASSPAVAATQPSSQPASAGANPPAPGFDAAGSDSAAVAIADSVMERMGGRAAWDATRHLSFTFFGSRHHAWNRHTGDIRVEGQARGSGEPYVTLMNLHDGTGRAWLAGRELEGADLEARLRAARAAWINDTYWLVMPYKLKDTGVTLTSAGRRPTADGVEADVLELRFTGVGETPQNKYHVYVGVESGLVEQWDFFGAASDAEPRIQTPWKGWTRHGRILLSGDRGTMRGRDTRLTNIAVHEDLPSSVYASPDPTDLFDEE